MRTISNSTARHDPRNTGRCTIDAAQVLNAFLSQIPHADVARYLTAASIHSDQLWLAVELHAMSQRPDRAIDALLMTIGMYMSFVELAVPCEPENKRAI